MERSCWRPARNALKNTMGIGNFPASASLVAAMNPSVHAGSNAMVSASPITGTRLASDMIARNMKKRPDKANGWRKKVRIPRRTHRTPVRAGTILSFMV